MKLISLFMDVEDPVNPAADDAALDFANIFSELGVRGSFCVTGEKCRRLLDRGRLEVIAALGLHSLGLHTDSHSVHPTTMEMLAELDYAEGCRVAHQTESKGVEAFFRAFGRLPEFWGGAGNTWSPEIPEVVGHLGIPSYAYALTELPGKPVHRFNGAFAMPQAIGISEDAIADDPGAIERTLVAIANIAQPWMGVFVGHPTRYRFPAFWDLSYFGGRTPDEPERLVPVPEERYQRSRQRLSKLIAEVQSEYKIIGADEVPRLPWRFSKPSESDLEYFAMKSAENIRGAALWPIHRPGLNAETIVAKTLERVGSLQTATLDSTRV